MGIKRNRLFWVLIIVLSLFQLYYFQENSGLDKKIPALNRINNMDLENGGIEVMYLALLAPVIVLIFFFAEWKQFYVDSYGILQITRNVDIRRYMANIFEKIFLHVYIYMVIILLINCIFDHTYVRENVGKVLMLCIDYYIAVVDVCIFVFVLSLFLKRQLVLLFSVAGIILSSLTSDAKGIENIVRWLFLQHIVRYPEYRTIFDVILGVIIGIFQMIILYVISIMIFRKKEFLWGEL